MAFVFRSPRALDEPIEPSDAPLHASQCDCTASESEILNQAPKASPSKGFAYKHFQREYGNRICSENALRNLTNLPEMERRPRQIMKKKHNDSQQYFFKSKCEREISQRPKFERELSWDKTDLNDKLKAKAYMFSKQNGKPITLLEAKKKIKKIEKSPSIPGKMEKFGYVMTKDNESYLRLPEKVSKPRFEGVKEDSPGPGEYNTLMKHEPKGIVKYSPPKKDMHNLNDEYTGMFALVSDQQALSLHNQKIKEWLKKQDQSPKQRRYKLVKNPAQSRTRADSTSSNNSGITVYDDDTTPGPGYYLTEINEKKNFRSNKQELKKIFINKSQRFEPQREDVQDSLDFIDIKNDKGQRKNFYISKLKRDLVFDIKPTHSSPEFYDTRKNIENDIISKVLRNSPNLFNNGIPRIPNLIKSDTPGPGCYDPTIPQFKVETIPPATLAKQPKQNLQQIAETKFKETQNSLIRKKDSNMNICIHTRKDEVIESENYAPFGSNSPKSKPKALSPVPHSYVSPKTSVPPKENKTAFNTSQTKFGSLNGKQDSPGVGLYQLNSMQAWDVKSYNVLFN